MTEKQLPIRPSSGELTFSCVQDSVEQQSSVQVCDGPLGWTETKQTHLALCVVIQASFKAKDLRLGVPTNITGIRLMEPDQGSPYL